MNTDRLKTILSILRLVENELDIVKNNNELSHANHQRVRTCKIHCINLRREVEEVEGWIHYNDKESENANG